MSDSTLNRFLASGTTADRLAFTPTPPTPASGPDPGYTWWDTDLQALYAYDFGTAAWVATGGGSGGGGAVVQVVKTLTGAVATGTTVIPFDDTIPQNTEGDEFMSLAVTPTDAANLLKIDVVFFGTSNATNWITVALFMNAVANALAAFANFQLTATAGNNSVFTFYMLAGTTSTITFKVRAGRDASAGTTVTFNGQSGGRIFGGVMASSITITEIVP
jgi:hypothetical protein